MKNSVRNHFFILFAEIFSLSRKNAIGTSYFTVTFDANGGTQAPKSRRVTDGAKVSEPPPVSRNGFGFDGWFADPGFTRQWDFDTDRVNDNIVLYAKWVALSKNQAFVWVVGGSFVMGDDAIPCAYPAHKVRVNGFYMGKCQITQFEYATLMADNPSKFKSMLTFDHPVDSLTWYEAVCFCNRLSAISGFQPVYTITNRIPVNGPSITSATVTADFSKNGYRLPTEAEWEYAAKGGNSSPVDYPYAGSNAPEEAAWYNLVSCGRTHVVGQKTPNGLGIYDMSGNVNEWCWDCFDEDYYYNSPMANPTGPESPVENTDVAQLQIGRAHRGGSWNNMYKNVRTSVRGSLSPSSRSNVMGFRVVRRP